MTSDPSATLETPAAVRIEEAFRRLQGRLAPLWKSVEDAPSYAHSTVIVPSLSFDAEELAKISGVAFYEERLLFLLMRLRNPSVRVAYVTSQAIPPEIIDYYLDLLVGVPASHARSRLLMLCVHDASPRPLTQKILERPRVVERLRAWVGNRERAYLSCFNCTELERELAVQLDVPLNGLDPDLRGLGTKSGSRRVFREAGISFPDGSEDLKSVDDVVEGLMKLGREHPELERAVVKLDESFAGEGNALFTYPAERASAAAYLEALKHMKWSGKAETFDSYFAKLARLGGIVECFVVAEETRSPSVQLRIQPGGSIQLVSTHEQLLGGQNAQAYLGCEFPAREEYRELLQREALRVADVLARRGVVSRFAIDFVVWRGGGSREWRAEAIEINLRLGGTTFPFLALEFLSGGALDPATGLFHERGGTAKYYVATDALESRAYRGLLPQDLMDLLIRHQLVFDPGTRTGVVFHMIGALSQYGKLGLIAIEDSPRAAHELFARTRRILDSEAGTATDSLPEVELPAPARRID